MAFHICRGLFLCASALLLGVPPFAQQPALKLSGSGHAKQQPPTVRVTTRLVQVSVVAHDKKGNPVADLRREDFTLLDEGHLQTIQLFSIETNDPPFTPPAALAPNTFTNRFGQQLGAPVSITVILLDGLNTQLEDQVYARDQVIKFLQQVQPQDRVALYTLNEEPRLLHDFTSDPSLLLRALANYRVENSPVLATWEPDERVTQFSKFAAGVDTYLQTFATVQRVDMTATALEWIAQHLAGLPGRKNLVWVSDSFPIFFVYDNSAARALSNANVALYPVDARGMAASNIQGFLKYPIIPKFVMPSHAGIDTMNYLADATGGRAFYNTNNIQGSIRRAIDDSRVTYVLGYYPNHGKWDGEFRSIKIEVKRAGVHVRSRGGYFALPDEQLDARQRMEIMYEAAVSPLDATALALMLHVNPPAVPGSRLIHVQLQLDPHQVRLEWGNGSWKGVLDLDFVQRNAQGKIVNATDQVVRLELFDIGYAKTMREGFQFSKEIEVEENAAELRVIARDEATGVIGSVSIPVGKLFSASAQ
jgi:VWFA-related protein